MFSVKGFVIERAVDFIRILEEDFPNTVFTSSFPRFCMTSLIGYRNFSVLCTCHVLKKKIHCLFFKSGQCM